MLEVRYEKLLENPSGEVARIAEFCEVEDAGPLVAWGCRHLRADHPVYAAVQPSPEKWIAIRRRIAPLLDQLGYG